MTETEELPVPPTSLRQRWFGKSALTAMGVVALAMVSAAFFMSFLTQATRLAQQATGRCVCLPKQAP